MMMIMKNNYHYKDYVCPKCFRQITKCNCERQSWHLIMIDYAIQEAIKTLNDNGLITAFCCAGHYKKPHKMVEIQVKFAHKIKNAPEGWKINNNNNIYFDFHPKSREEFEIVQNKEIQKLIEWGNNYYEEN